ncbi:ArsR/SmtB family transcription factor [Streptomyces sp. BYX5S]
MPLHLRFGREDLLRCRFAISPLWETQEAIRTLKRPDRHGYHLPWLRRVRAAAEGLDLAPVWLLMPQRGHTPDFLGPPPIGPAATFDEEIAALRATAPDEALRGITQSLACTPGAARSPLGRALAAEPARAVRELADLLELAWQALVEPEWPRLRALLEADVAHHSRRLAEVGLEGLLKELHPRVDWEPGTLTLTARASEHRRDLDGRGLVLLPSVFCWPDVVSGFEPPWQPTVAYPARGVGALWSAPAARTPDALANLLGRGRADVLDALAEPASTSALAHRLGRAPSSVSAHLSALRGAGLLTSRRHGHQVLYERTPLGSALVTGDQGA